MKQRSSQLVILLFLMSINLLNAQVPKWEAGGLLGISQYQGDVNNLGTKGLNPAFGLLLRRHFTNQFALRGNLLFGKLSGKDSDLASHAVRGFTFSSPMTEISLIGEYDFLGKKRYNSEGIFSKKVTPFIFTGVGAVVGLKQTVNYNEAKTTATASKIAQDKASTKTSFTSLPIGLGVRFDVNETWAVNLEVGKRYTFSDVVDKVKETGNPNKNDTYIIGGATINYRFGGGSKKAAKPTMNDAEMKGIPMNGEIRRPTDLKTSDLKIMESAAYGVQFETGKYSFKQESYTILDQIVSVMNTYPNYKLFISGNTDNTGNMTANQTLSEKRAEACFQYLVSKGIVASRMVHRGFGQTKPVSDNSTPEGRMKNRRVDFDLSTQ
jgi:outer membrane protein OmpA-like peptidoglycan-associated protein